MINVPLTERNLNYNSYLNGDFSYRGNQTSREVFSSIGNQSKIKKYVNNENLSLKSGNKKKKSQKSNSKFKGSLIYNP